MWTVEKEKSRFHYAYNGVRKCYSKDVDWSLVDYLEASVEWMIKKPSDIYEYEYKDGKFIEYLSL